MILGTGIDLLKVSRVKKILDKYGDLFIKKIFSDEEMKNNKEIIFKVNRLAKSFATKEAFVKALGTGFTKHISFKDISLSMVLVFSLLFINSIINNNIFIYI